MVFWLQQECCGLMSRNWIFLEKNVVEMINHRIYGCYYEHSINAKSSYKKVIGHWYAPGTRRDIVLVSTRSPSVVYLREKMRLFFHEICVVVGWALRQASQSWTLTNNQSTVRLRGSRFWTAKTEERRKVLLECLWRVGGKVFYRYTTSQTLIGGSSSNTSLLMFDGYGSRLVFKYVPMINPYETVVKNTSSTSAILPNVNML